MIIIGVITPPENGSSFYRCHIPFNYLAKDHVHIKVKYLSELTWGSMSDIDVLFMMRADNSAAYKAITYARLMGIPSWIDMDDDFFAVPKDNPNHKHYSDPDTLKWISLCMQEATVISFSTEFLKVKYDAGLEKVSTTPPRTLVIKNAANTRLFKFEDHKNRNNIIAWRGSSTHSGDIKTVAKYCEQLGHEWHFIGYKPVEFGIRLHTTYQEPMDAIVYMNYLKDIKPKVMIVPLVDNDFNRAKSNIAWIEATMAGAVTIAPTLPEFEKPGIVNYSKPEEFLDKLKYVLNMSENEKYALVMASRLHIDYCLHLDHENAKRLDLIHSLVMDK